MPAWNFKNYPLKHSSRTCTVTIQKLPMRDLSDQIQALRLFCGSSNALRRTNANASLFFRNVFP